MGDVRLVMSFIGKRWKAIAIGSIFVIATNLLNVLIPSLVGKAVDLLSTDFAMRALIRLSALMLMIEFSKGVFRFLMRYIIIGNSWKIENDLRLRLYSHLLKLPMPYYSRTRTGDIVARLTNDLTAVRMMVGPAIMYTVNAVVLLPATLAFMFAIDAKLALYSIIPFPFIAIMINRVMHTLHHDFKLVQESYSDISAHVQENLNGIGTVKAYVREEHELGTLRALSLDYVWKNRRVIKLQSIFHPLLDVMASTGVLIVLWLGAYKVAAGETSLGTIVSLVMYIGLLVWPSIALGWVLAMFQRGTASAHRIMEILDETPERQDSDESIEPFHGGITLKALTFSYDVDSEVLHDISFDLKPGGTLAVVGRTGSGKSTLMSILSGAYDVGRGMVFFDGQDINDVPLSRLRASISLVPQETFLFSETVAENIAFGREGADMQEIRLAASLASIDAEIDTFPDDFQTRLGERGFTVSGGQRQRIAIARALVSDAPILLFDDCLANVDIGTEMKILTNIRQVIRDKTAIIVTQRLGAITDADEIIYMKHGTISERGTHDELMALNGEYAALYREQETIIILDDLD